MFRRGKWAVAAVLLAAWAGGLAAAAEPDKDDKRDTARPSWLSRWFGDKKKVEKKKEPAAAKETMRKPPARPAVPSRSRETADYLRRLQVCDKLMQIAYETQDQELQRQVEQLNEQVWETYQLRSARATSRPRVTDEHILDKHLGSKATTKSETEEALLDSTPSKGRSGRTALKEDKP
jgi:hypothetical protein